MARDERATWSNSIDEQERRAALARRTFALELDAAVTIAQRSTRKVVPFMYGLAALGALLAVVAVVRLTRRPSTALIRVTIPPAEPPARSSFLRAMLRAPLERGMVLTLARLALQRFAAMDRGRAHPLLPALSSVAATSLAGVERQHQRNAGARARGELRQP